MPTEPAQAPEHKASGIRWLLIIPFVAVLWVPFYNDVEPRLWSAPLFYWYQLLWVLLCAVVISIVYVVEHKRS